MVTLFILILLIAIFRPGWVFPFLIPVGVAVVILGVAVLGAVIL